MAPQALWSGSLRLSLVLIPVKLFPALSSEDAVSFRMIHKPSGKPICYLTHFAVVSAADATRVGQVHTGATAQTQVIGNTAYTRFTPGSSFTVIKPGEDAYIRIFSLPPGQPTPPGAYAADEIIRFVGSRVKRA